MVALGLGLGSELGLGSGSGSGLGLGLREAAPECEAAIVSGSCYFGS